MTASVVTEAYIKYIMLSTGYMARPKLSENARRMFNKARESQVEPRAYRNQGTWHYLSPGRPQTTCLEGPCPRAIPIRSTLPMEPRTPQEQGAVGRS
jgi:hypothetical protein